MATRARASNFAALDEHTAAHVAELFGAFSDTSRVRIISVLVKGEQNVGALAQARQLESRLEAFSLDPLQVAKTNAAAKQIVQEFNIQWTPGPATPVPAPASSNQTK